LDRLSLDEARDGPHIPSMTRRPQIVASGGGGFSMEPGNPLLDDYVLSLTGVERPRVCFMPTASGDADHYIVRFYRAFPSTVCEPSHVSLFRRDRGCGIDADIAGHLLDQDLIYVGGGSLVSLLDEVLRDCWRRGTVLCGLSAGSLCWFSEALTAFHGAPRRAEGLGLLPWSNCVHYDGESGRREAYLQLIENGMVPGYAAENGTALHFVGGELARVVASRDGAQAYRVEAVDGVARETALPVVSLRGTAGLVLA
jgi:dipeptidase E